MRFGIFLPMVLFLFSSCEDGSRTSLPNASGKPGEVIAVVDRHYWKSDAGKAVRKTLARAQYGLPQGEPLFDITNIPHRSFTEIFQGHRNIFVADISKKNEGKKPSVKVQRNVWAKGQMVIYVTAHSQAGFVRLMKERGQGIAEAYRKEELKRLIVRYKGKGNRKLTEKLVKKHNLSLAFQQGFKLASEGERFAWYRLERERPAGGYRHQISQGILVYYYEYSDTAMVSAEHLLAAKDSVTKKYIPGPSDGSYMTTSHKVFEPQAKETNFKGRYAVEIRGLWRVEGDFMGGPFISLTTVDEQHSRVVTIEGYVFAPQFDKREYLREVEAVVKSLELTE